jgi:hypothetical protein
LTTFFDKKAEAYFECHQKSDGFDGVVSSVDVVSHEQVVSVWRLATDPATITNGLEYRKNLNAETLDIYF